MCFRPSAAQGPPACGEYCWHKHPAPFCRFNFTILSTTRSLLHHSALKNHDKIWGILFSEKLLRKSPKTSPTFILMSFAHTEPRPGLTLTRWAPVLSWWGKRVMERATVLSTVVDTVLSCLHYGYKVLSGWDNWHSKSDSGQVLCNGNTKSGGPRKLEL